MTKKRNKKEILIGAGLLAAAIGAGYYLYTQQVSGEETLGGGFAEPGGAGRYIITTEETVPTGGDKTPIIIPSMPSPTITYPSIAELMPTPAVQPTTTKKDETVATEPATVFYSKDYGGGAVGGRAGAPTVYETTEPSLLSRLTSALGIAVAPVSMPLALASTAVSAVAKALGGGEAAVASGAAPVTYAGRMTGVTVYGPAGSTTKKAESAGMPTAGVSEEVGTFIQSGSEYAGSKPVGTTGSGGTVYESATGARQVVSGGQIVAGTSRGLDAYDVARLPESQRTALGYSGGKAYTPGGQVYHGGKVYSKKAAKAAGLI